MPVACSFQAFLIKTPRQASLESCGNKDSNLEKQTIPAKNESEQVATGSGGRVTIALKGTTANVFTRHWGLPKEAALAG